MCLLYTCQCNFFFLISLAFVEVVILIVLRLVTFPNIETYCCHCANLIDIQIGVRWFQLNIYGRTAKRTSK